MFSSSQYLFAKPKRVVKNDLISYFKKNVFFMETIKVSSLVVIGSVLGALMTMDS